MMTQQEKVKALYRLVGCNFTWTPLFKDLELLEIRDGPKIIKLHDTHLNSDGLEETVSTGVPCD